MYHFFFCWHLLICKVTLIQVVKLQKKKKKKEEKIPNSARRRHKPAISPLGHECLLLSSDVNFTIYFFFHDKLPKHLPGVFPGKMCSARCKNHGCGQKKPKSTSSAIFGVETAAKCCELERCADRVRNRTGKAIKTSIKTLV